MITHIDNFLNHLVTIKNGKLKDLQYAEGKFSFEYGGGKFFLVKSVAADLRIGFLTLFHETPFTGERHLIEIPDFEIKIINEGMGVYYKIRNHMEFSPEDSRRYVDQEGYMRLGTEDLEFIFPNQLTAKLIKDHFRIYV